MSELLDQYKSLQEKIIQEEGKEEERILSERCAASLPTFDTYPCREASIDDIYADIIVSE